MFFDKRSYFLYSLTDVVTSFLDPSFKVPTALTMAVNFATAGRLSS
jgi:hypothetical protein